MGAWISGFLDSRTPIIDLLNGFLGFPFFWISGFLDFWVLEEPAMLVRRNARSDSSH